MNSVQNNKQSNQVGLLRCDDVFNMVRDFLPTKDRLSLLFVNKYIHNMKDPKIDGEMAMAKKRVALEKDQDFIRTLRKCHV